MAGIFSPEVVRKGQWRSKLSDKTVLLRPPLRGFVPSCETLPGTAAVEPDASYEATKQWQPKQHITFQIFAGCSASAGVRLFGWALASSHSAAKAPALPTASTLSTASTLGSSSGQTSALPQSQPAFELFRLQFPGSPSGCSPWASCPPSSDSSRRRSASS